MKAKIAGMLQVQQQIKALDKVTESEVCKTKEMKREADQREGGKVEDKVGKVREEGKVDKADKVVREEKGDNHVERGKGKEVKAVAIKEVDKAIMVALVKAMLVTRKKQ